MTEQSLPEGTECVYVRIDIDAAEKRDFYNGDDKSPADIDWAYHLRMGDLRFVENARLATVPDASKIIDQARQQFEEELLSDDAIDAARVNSGVRGRLTAENMRQALQAALSVSREGS